MSAVDKIAEVLLAFGEPDDPGLCVDDFLDDAEAVVAAIKAMSPSELAELIGGYVETGKFGRTRTVGPWIAD